VANEACEQLAIHDDDEEEEDIRKENQISQYLRVLVKIFNN